MMKRLGACVIVALTLAGCAGIDIERYRAERPVLALPRFFSGTLDGWGMVQGRDGEVKRRFHVVIQTAWDGGTGTLDERFAWSDGTSSERRWTLHDLGDGRWRGVAADVVGEARGEVAGNALHWQYTLSLPVDDTRYDVQFDDWMFLIGEDVLLNRATMRKWGIDVGEVTLVLRRRAS